MIIMDEPTSALSKAEVEHLYEIIDTLKEKGVAIMFVSHKMDELFRVADRFTVFRDGQYVDTVDRDKITESELVSFTSSSRISLRSFLSIGRKASKANLLVGRPDKVRAVIHAAGPGREVTSIPAS